jgi:hypothetical protein
MKIETILLDEESNASLSKALKDINMSSSHIQNLINSGNLDQKTSATMVTFLENQFLTIAKLLDYDSHLIKEATSRYVDIKKANEKIRELKEKIGSDKPKDGLQEQLKYLHNVVNEWWNEEGFNHTSEAKFYPNGGLQLEFCFMLEHRRGKRENGVFLTEKRNKKEHIQYLKDKGFEFHENSTDSSEQLHLIDKQSNRNLLAKMLRDRFPSIEIQSWNNKVSYSDGDIYTIWNVDASIYNLSDI